jgi:hypothetical protein
MKSKKIIISCIAAATLLTSSLEASWRTYAQDSIAVQTTSPTTIKTSVSRSFSGGGVRVRWGSMGTVSPIHAEAPSYSVGCNGIDIRLGSMSFMEFDELVDKLKMIASAAPAFAFKMAIDTVCAQCSTIMQDLSDAVDTINGLSLNSCKTAQALGGGAGEALGNAINQGTYGDGYKAIMEEKRNKAQVERTVIGQYLMSVNASKKGEVMYKKFGYGSLLQNVATDTPKIGTSDTKDFIKIFRSIAGDLVVLSKKGESETKVEKLEPTESLERLVKLMVGEEDGSFTTTDLLLYNEAGAVVNGKVTSETDMPTTYSTPTSEEAYNGSNNNWVTKSQSTYDAIISAIQNRQHLTQDNIQKLTGLPNNGYRIITAFALNRFPDAILTKEEYAKYIALVNAKEILVKTLDFTIKATKSQYNAAGGFAESKNEQLKDTAIRYMDEVEKLRKDSIKLKAWEQIPILEKKIIDALKYLEKSRANTIKNN